MTMQDAFNNNPLFDPNNLPASHDCRELLELFGQLNAAFLNSGLRYWRSLAELYGNNTGDLCSAFIELCNNPELSTAERRQQVEKLRAWLRQAGELMDRESRVLQNQFADIDSKLQQFAGEGQTNAPKRYVRAKS